MLIKLDDGSVNSMIEALRLHAFDDCGGKDLPTHICNIAADMLAALRALPVSDGWEDKSLDKLDAWRFNVMLECQGGDGKCVIGGAELNLNDLLEILDFVSDRCPLPAPPSE